MLKFLFGAGIALGLALAGCNSFNKTTYLEVNPEAIKATSPVLSESHIGGLVVIVPDTRVDPAIVKVPPPAPPDESSAVTKGLCPAYRMPTLPPTPDVPIKQLDAIKPSDDAAVAALAREHIVELHKYIDQTQRILKISYQDYVKRCQSHRKTTARHAKS
jgi:hypothetical protein